MQNNKRKILVTSALTYGNGPLHLGHMVEHIQIDIWARFQRLMGHECFSISGVDAHGTPIMIKAEQQNISPIDMVNANKQSNEKDLSDFFIHYDNYISSHSSTNENLAGDIYTTLKNRGDIITRTIEQAYDSEKNMFLPDRYVKGSCPKCHAPNQYGDNCEVCSATYDPLELIEPISILSNTTPIKKSSKHFFFNLPNYEELLQQWVNGNSLQTEVANKLQEWFKDGLREWDISRDHPYFGFKIPGEKDKYFYVWLDAPIGYMAAFKDLSTENSDISFDEFWKNDDNNTELYHFIGKDIMYFHALFWPAILAASEHRLPTGIFAHGFLTINGQKMSKSKGTFITANSFAIHLPTETLRYYFAAKLNNKIEDLDLNFTDLKQRINSDLVGKFVNIASRNAGFIHKHFSSTLSNTLDDQELYNTFIESQDKIANLYENRDFAKAVRQIMSLAEKANQYIDSQKPWVLIKDEKNSQKVHDVCTMGINLFRVLSIYLKPILPQLTTNAENFLNISNQNWHSIHEPLLGCEINHFQPLIKRIEDETIANLLNEH